MVWKYESGTPRTDEGETETRVAVVRKWESTKAVTRTVKVVVR